MKAAYSDGSWGGHGFQVKFLGVVMNPSQFSRGFQICVCVRIELAGLEASLKN